ncbi:hypothetical protein B0T26DRAFT_710812, partial [Lasiosphaeria miniovina]
KERQIVVKDEGQIVVKDNGQVEYSDTDRLAKGRKRKIEDSPLDRPKRTLRPYSNGDFKSLFRLCRSFNQEYRNSKPISEVDFIWKFIDSIDNPGLSRHVQELLAASLPEYIYTRKETRRSNQHHINISGKLSWDEFKNALVKTAIM